MAHKSTVSSLARRWSFFMRRLLPAGQSVQLPDAACGSETPTRAIDADIVVDQVALGACFGGKPTSSFHPIDFQTIPLHWACPEAPFANQQSDQRSISKAVRCAIPHADPPRPFCSNLSTQYATVRGASPSISATWQQFIPWATSNTPCSR